MERSKGGTKGKEVLTAYHYLIKIIITCNDFLPPPRRGSYVKSDNTHTQSSNKNPLAQILDTCALIFSSCARFTVYPNRIM